MNVDVNITGRQVTQEIGVHISKSKQSLLVRREGSMGLLAASSLEKKSEFPVNAAYVLLCPGALVPRRLVLPAPPWSMTSGRDTGKRWF